MRNGTLWTGTVGGVDFDVDWCDGHYEVFRRDQKTDKSGQYVGWVDSNYQPEEMHERGYIDIVTQALEQEANQF